MKSVVKRHFPQGDAETKNVLATQGRLSNADDVAPAARGRALNFPFAFSRARVASRSSSLVRSRSGWTVLEGLALSGRHWEVSVRRRASGSHGSWRKSRVNQQRELSLVSFHNGPARFS